MTNRLSISMTVLAAMLLASCSNTLTCGNSHPYTNYASKPPLKAPAGVTLPVPDPAYAVPAASTAASAQVTAAPSAASNGAQPCLVTPPDVLTKADMARPERAPAPATVVKPAAVPAAGTPALATPVPAAGTHAPAVSATHVPPVAAIGSME